jgi:hypothetical protein
MPQSLAIGKLFAGGVMKRLFGFVFCVTLVAACSDESGPGPECVTDEDCPAGQVCLGAECQDDPCANITCDDPPDAECADANNVRIYTTPGACTEGTCDYPYQDINCPNGCENGLCKDCVPEWVDVTACDCTPSECAGCDGTKQQSDGCGNTQDVACHMDPTGCITLCCGGVCCSAGEICSASEQCEAGCSNDCDLSGSRECDTATSWHECADWDTDGCLEWGGETGCGAGETCQAGACIADCGCGAGEACIDGKCAPIAILLAREGAGGATWWCPMGYYFAGRWKTGPGAGDGAVEGIDFHKFKIDLGWVWVCSADLARVSVVNTVDPCASNTSTCAGQIRGSWRVGSGCGGSVAGVDVNGQQLEDGHMGLCVTAGTDAKVETGHNDCGVAGPGCGAFNGMGNWHISGACDGDPSGVGDSGWDIPAGWMALCADSSSFPPVDTNTLTGKLVTGYQGWFAAPNDGSQRNRWIHWFRTQDPVPQNATFDLWPDLSELDADELFDTGMQYSGGGNAALFSSYTPKTVNRHMKWMAQYGIDAAFLQRFNSTLSGGGLEHRDQVTRSVMAGAEEYNRAFIIMYDISGADAGTLVANFKADWIHLVDDLGVTASPAYLRHGGRPLVAIWGFGFNDRPGTPADALEMIDFFHNNPTPRYRATVMGGVPTNWRTGTGDSQPGFDTAYRSFDVISPWSVGRYNSENGVVNFNTNYIQPDLTEAASAGADYMPVVWPGFSWANLRQDPGIFNNIPRDGGSFFWKQFYEAQNSGCTQIYVAMFDEVDESTAIFKAAATQAELPTTGQFLALDQDGISVPNDWYLRLSGAGMKTLAGQTPLSANLPVK